MSTQPPAPRPSGDGPDPDTETADDGGAPARRRPSRRTRNLVVFPLIALWMLFYAGQAIFPSLVDSHPAWLIAMNPSNRYLVLTSNRLDPWTYYGIGFTRLLLSDPLWFLIGYWYGDAAITWMENRTQDWGRWMRKAEKGFGKAKYPLVFLAPNNFICLFAGAAGMPVRLFFAVNAAGTAVRLFVIRRFGDVFQEPIDDLVDWIRDQRRYLLPITIGLTILSIALQAKRGETEATSLAHLEDEIDEAERDS